MAEESEKIQFFRVLCEGTEWYLNNKGYLACIQLCFMLQPESFNHYALMTCKISFKK